jgi:hypothetical protein
MGDYQSSTKFLPTQDEKDALTGTGATPPSRFNPFVTDDDIRLGGMKAYLFLSAASLVPDEPPDNPDEPPPAYSPTYKQMRVSLDFAPGGTAGAQMSVALPPTYDGGPLAAIFYGACAEAQDPEGATVQWGIAAAAFGDGLPEDTDFGGVCTVEDTYVDADVERLSPKSGDITPSGAPGGNCRMNFRISCPAGTLVGLARLKGVLIEYGLAA